MEKKKIIWIGLAVLVVDLFTYLSQIRSYFTTIGQIGLVAAIVLIAYGNSNFKL